MRRVLIAVALLLFPAMVFAQNTDIESLAGIIFNFANPGARALGMGGAFMALADDASAVEANPAGLSVLRKTEISIELRNYEQKKFLTTSGTYPDLERTGFSLGNRMIQPTFFSFVRPVGRFVVGAYYHEVLRNKGTANVLPQFNPINRSVVKSVPVFFLPKNGNAPVSEAECQALVKQTNDPFACLEFTLIPFTSFIDMNERTVGAVAAYTFRSVSVGLTARFQRFTETAGSVDFNANTFEVDNIRRQTSGTTASGRHENDVTFTTGVKWSARPWLSVGAVYKEGAKFPTSMFLSDANGVTKKIAATKFHVPDIYGLGLSVRPLPVLTINADALRINYSNLTDNFHSFSEELEAAGHPYVISNGTEMHVGAEYFFAARVPFAVRAGWWRDPSHTLRYTGPLNDPERIAVGILFPGESSQNHISVGAGWSWPRFEIDAAYDYSKNNRIASMSVVQRFGR